MFEFETIYWSLAFITLHSICGFLLILFFRKFSDYSGFRLSSLYLFLAGLTWLLNPYHTDVVVFKVCQHYMFCLIIIFTCLLLFLYYLKKPGQNYFVLIGIGLLTLSSLFFKEFGYMLPFMIIVIGMSDPTKSEMARILTSLPAVIASVLGLIAYWIWKSLYFPFGFQHEGYTEVNYFNMDSLLSNVEKYFFKYLIFTRHFPHHWKHNFNEFIGHYGIWITLFVLCAVGVYFLIKRRYKPYNNTALSFLSLAVLGWLPTASLYYSYVLLGSNDRFGYVGSAFFILFLFSICQRLSKHFKYLLLGSYLLMSAYLLYDMNIKWQKNAIVQESLIEDFRWMKEEKVYILSIPHNFHGIYLFRTGHKSPSTFYDHLKWIEGKEAEGAFIELNQYNMMSLEDGVSVHKKDPLHWYVEFNQWGNWSWKAYQGATDYNTDKFRVEYKGNGYHLYFKQKPKETDVYIYQDGLKWKEVDI
jgi:hypothetical protein